MRNEIAKIALDPCNKVWRERLRLILQKVRQVVDFEHAIFGVYADDLTLFRAVAIFEEHSIDWPARWMVLPPGFVRSWIDAGVYWVEDLETFVDEHEVLRSSEVVQAYLRAGIRSSVTLIVQSNEGPTSALTLCSKAPHQFNEEHCAILREIGLEPVLLRCEAQIRQERQAFAEEVREIVATSDDLAAGCMDIVDKIRTRLDWDFAALFRVDRHQSQFRLVHQSVSDERFREASGTNYVQSIIKGMLGATLQQGTVLTVDSVHAGDADQYGFLRALKGARSVMTVPIRLNHRVRWILHVESAETHCFRGPDQEEVKHLSRLIEAGLAQRMLQEIKAFVMHESERGIVMVGMDGEVLEMNKAAAGMLGRPTLQVTEPFRLSDHAYNDHARAVLDREVNTSNRRIELKGEHGERCLVFATCKDLEESFDTALWFFTDLRKMAWDRDMRFLRETVAEFAQQARPPLSLASSLVRQLPKVIRALMAPQNDEEKAHSQVRAEETCDRIALEIGKADITFERLAEAHAIRQTPMRERQRVNLAHCLDGVIEAFPKRDQRHIDFERDAQAVCIMGDEGRLSFVVRSILAHLLRTRPFDDTRILTKLSIVDCSDRPEQTALVRLCFQLSGPVETARTSRHPGRQDALQAAYDEARSDASLAFDAIWRVVHAHDGLIETEPPESFRRDPSVIVTSFAMRFPACTDRRIKNEAE
ncbi:PAS domain-containing protein [Paraburkholderia atlantica]|uniref:PAS domain-containing protein n=1 Tax=Paraburkholderia atlantica TaxID=2654982 RepID=UPI003D20B377